LAISVEQTLPSFLHLTLLPVSGKCNWKTNRNTLLLSQFQAGVNLTGLHHRWAYSVAPLVFQRLMEGVLRNISNVIVYIDDLLVHTQTHEEHIQVLEKVLERLHTNNLKINLEKCFYRNKEVSYLGFTLMPAGIKPGKNKLRAIKDDKPDVKTIRSFVGLCNFFRTQKILQ
jgi:hypothetical protein